MKLLLVTLTVAAACGVPANVFAQRPAIKEVKHSTVPVAAPRECLSAFRQFFSYVQKAQPDIVHDEVARKRWLSQELRKALLEKVATYTSEDHDPPSNASFVGAWDFPTTYAIVGSRRYGQRAIVDVLYKWGPNTHYSGDERTSSFVFVFEDGAWKLDDIYTFRGGFVTPGSLNEWLRGKDK